MTTSNLLAPLAPPPAVAPVAPSCAVAESGFPGLDDGLDWRRVLSALLRFKWLIAAVTLAGTAAGVGATRFLTPEYVAQATVWIDGPDRRGPDRGPIRPGQLLDPEAWVELLKSYVVLDEVVREQRLLDRKSTRLNSSHGYISYAVFCL